MNGDDAIVVERLSKRFGEFTAVDEISFNVARGEVFGFLGPNGAGKTTVIRMLLGLLQPTSGRALVLGYELPRQAKTLHGRVGYMSQLFTLYDDLTARENIRFYGQAFGLQRGELRQRMDEILTMAGLKGRENELTAQLSGAGDSAWPWVAQSSISLNWSFSTSRRPAWTPFPDASSGA